MGAIFELARRDITAIIEHLQCEDLELSLVERLSRADNAEVVGAPEVARLIVLGALSPSRRLIAYSAAVIALYGAFERFVEDLLESFASGYPARIPHYGELDSTVRDQHLRLSLELAAKLAKDTLRSKLDVGQIIRNLADCMSVNPGETYVFNGEAFRVHFGNIRSAKLSELFNAVGIPGVLANVTKVAPFSRWIHEEIVAERLVKSDREKLAFLDDFVERRNEIAHGRPAEILSLELIDRYAQFLLALCESLERITVDSELADRCKQCVSIGRPVSILKKINVLTFDLSAAKVAVGDRILVKRNNSGGLRYAEFQIVSLMVENAPRRVVTARKKPVPLGIKVSGAPVNGEYFVKR